MTSTLQVQTLQGPTSGADSNTIRVADNHKLYAKGHVVQVQTYHVAALSGAIETSSGSWQETGCKVTITPEFSNSLIVCDFVASLAIISPSTTGSLQTRLLLNNVAYGGTYTTGYMQRSDISLSSHQATVFKTIHTNLAAGTPAEFNLQFASEKSGEQVTLAYTSSAVTMTLTEIAQ